MITTILDTSILLRGRGGDGPAVVAADEDDRRAQRGRKVEGGVEVAFAGGALTKVGNSHSLLLLQLRTPETGYRASTRGCLHPAYCRDLRFEGNFQLEIPGKFSA